MLTNLKLTLDIRPQCDESQNVIRKARDAMIAIFLAYSESDTSETDVS